MVAGSYDPHKGLTMYDPFDPFAEPSEDDPFLGDAVEPSDAFGMAVFGDVVFIDDPFLIDKWDADLNQVLEQQEREVEEFRRTFEDNVRDENRKEENTRDPDTSGSMRGPFANKKKARRYASQVGARTELHFDELDGLWYVFVYDS